MMDSSKLSPMCFTAGNEENCGGVRCWPGGGYLMSCGNIKVWSTRDRVIVNFHPCVMLQVMKRIVEEYGGDLVVATLCLVETSRFGLLETELL